MAPASRPTPARSPAETRPGPGAGEHLEARRHVQEPQDPELALPVAHERVGARIRVGLRIPGWRLALQDLGQRGVLTDVGKLAEMPVGHDLHTLPRVSPPI